MRIQDLDSTGPGADHLHQTRHATITVVHHAAGLDPPLPDEVYAVRCPVLARRFCG